MRADGCDEDDWVFGVTEGAAGGEIVGGAAGGGSNADAIGLDGGKVLVVAEDFDRGHGFSYLNQLFAPFSPENPPVRIEGKHALALGPLSTTISFKI